MFKPQIAIIFELYFSKKSFALFRHWCETFGEPTFEWTCGLSQKPYFLLVAVLSLKTASHFSGNAWALSGNQVFSALGFIPKPYFLLIAVLSLKTASHFSGTAWTLSGNRLLNELGIYPKTVLFTCRSAFSENRFALFRHCLGTFGKPGF